MYIVFREFYRRFTRMWGRFLLACTILYFSYHFISGQRGLWAWRQLQVDMSQKQQELLILKDEQQRMERRVSLLRPESASRDFVEERAKASLSYTRPNEIVVLHKKEGSQPK